MLSMYANDGVFVAAVAYHSSRGRPSRSSDPEADEDLGPSPLPAQHHHHQQASHHHSQHHHSSSSHQHQPPLQRSQSRDYDARADYRDQREARDARDMRDVRDYHHQRDYHDEHQQRSYHHAMPARQQSVHHHYHRQERSDWDDDVDEMPSMVGPSRVMQRHHSRESDYGPPSPVHRPMRRTPAGPL